MNLLLFGFLIVLITTLNLEVPNCSSQQQIQLSFTYTDGKPDNTTKASLCHDEKFLYVSWVNVDEEIISTYTKCNDPLYNEDAVQIFIASPVNYPHNYFEFEISPKSQLFFADITNPTGACANLGTQYYPCSAANYQAKIIKNGWQANLKIGLQIIGRGQIQKSFLINLFRIDKSTSKPTRYLTWQPTYVTPPCFHKPQYFQYITLV